MSVSVDGDTPTALVTQLTTDSAIVTRRQARTGVAAGRHTVTIRLTTSGVFYFNFLEAAVASAPPNALAPRAGISPALDFDTNQSYMLPPARIMWMMDQLGYAGPMNEYLGVFWWNERVQIGAIVFNRHHHFWRNLRGRRDGHADAERHGAREIGVSRRTRRPPSRSILRR